LATTVIWGANRRSGATTHSALAETEAVLDRSNTLYGRVELVQKTAEDLVLSSLPPSTEFNVTAVSAGYVREFVRSRGATLGVGLQGTINVLPAQLESFYGSKTPVGGMLFVRVRPLHGPHEVTHAAMPMD
jgi:hypothetical protein